MLHSQFRQTIAHRPQIVTGSHEGTPRQQHQGGVEHVLAREPTVQMRGRALVVDLSPQRRHARYDGIAGSLGVVDQGRDIRMPSSHCARHELGLAGARHPLGDEYVVPRELHAHHGRDEGGIVGHPLGAGRARLEQ
jgi:hypothetical protein